MQKIDNYIFEYVNKKTTNYQKDFIQLILQWPKIIGSKFASYAAPVNIRSIRDQQQKFKNILYLTSKNSSKASFLKFNEKYIIDRINQFYGYKLVHHLKVNIVPSYKSNKLQLNKMSVSKDEILLLEPKINNITDNETKEALLKLGSAFYNREK